MFSRLRNIIITYTIRILYILEMYLLKLNLSCLLQAMQQEAFLSTWTKIKQFMCFNEDGAFIKWQGSENSWTVRITQQQYLFNWKWC